MTPLNSYLKISKSATNPSANLDDEEYDDNERQSVSLMHFSVFISLLCCVVCAIAVIFPNIIICCSMPTHIVTNEATGEQYIVERAAAPGADLLDPDCQHGAPAFDLQNMTDFQKEWHPVVKMYLQRTSMLLPRIDRSPGPVFLLRCNQDFWTSVPKTMDILRRDTALEIPRMLWSSGVSGSCMEKGGANYSRMCIAGSLVTESLIQNLGANVQDLLDDLWDDMNAIDSDCGLYEYMHRENKRKCLCMQYVAAEAIKRTPKKCRLCDAALDKPQRCSRCKNVWYCNVSCQKQDWKMHKKVCRPPAGTI